MAEGRASWSPNCPARLRTGQVLDYWVVLVDDLGATTSTESDKRTVTSTRHLLIRRRPGGRRGEA